MAKTRIKYVCQQCGGESPQWLGRCPDCGGWNTFAESLETPASGDTRQLRHLNGPTAQPQAVAEVSPDDLNRLRLGIGEFDRVLGDGVVPGSLVLVGGDPGIGKSTLLLQAAARIAASGGTVLYVSGEESVPQVRMRAQRLDALVPGLLVLAETSLDAIVAHALRLRPRLLVIDSIQTVCLDELPSTPGSVTQLRESTLRLMQLAKSEHLPTFLVGHVTKDGSIAGPRALEHIVDTVLYLEGERFQSYRLLRAVKNRFGSTNEIGVFEMATTGLREVINPSAAFLSEALETSPGSAVVVPVEGSRALLVELQALVAATAFGLPRRTAIGLDLNRLVLLVAVLTKRVGLALSNQDVYVNVAGGLKIGEPACDLGVAVAIASSYRDVAAGRDLAVIGEIGLSGEVRPVGQLLKRAAEAARLGFRRCVVPSAELRRLAAPEFEPLERPNGLRLIGVRTVREALDVALSGSK